MKIYLRFFRMLMVIVLFLFGPMSTVQASSPISVSSSNVWTEYGSNPLFGGATDGVNRGYYPCVLKVGSTYHIWYGDGSNTRHASSANANFSGVSFPAAACTGLPAGAYHPRVLYNASGWTIGGTSYADPFLIYSTTGLNWSAEPRVAHSPDGDSWTEIGPTTGVIGLDAYYLVYNFDVLYEGGTTWKSYADNGWGQILYYTSTDGITWTGMATNIIGPPMQAWESSFTSPHVIKLDNYYVMFYGSGPTVNNQALGMAVSTDGQNFTKSNGNPIFTTGGSPPAWRDERTYTPYVVQDGSGSKMYFSGRCTATGAYSIGYGTNTGLFWLIQDALNAGSSGDIINVAAGTYVEQLDVSKNLTVVGDGPSTVIKCPATLSSFTIGGTARRPIVYVHGATVTVQQLLVDGDGKGNANVQFMGIAYHNASGTVDHVTITKLRNSPLDGAQYGVGLYARNEDAVARTLNVTNNTISDFQKNAMALLGSNLTVNVSNNTTTGAGPTGVTAQNGIQVSLSAGGTVGPGNTVSNVSYTGSTYTSSGILVFGHSMTTVQGNTVNNAQTGIYVYDGGATVNGNTVSASAAGTGRTGYNGMLVGDPERAKPSPFDEPEVLVSMMKQKKAPSSIASTATITVSSNTITGVLSDGSDHVGIYAFAGYFGTLDVSFSATNNLISGWAYGLYADQCASGCTGGAFTSAAATDNSLEGNTNALVSTITAFTFDASGNWYGSNDPAVVAAKVSANVDYTPWLNSGTDKEPGTAGFQGDFSNLWVSAASPQTGGGPYIQEGIGMVTGSTVNVVAGTYTENVNLNETVNLLGAGAASTTINGNGTGNCISLAANGVTIDGFTLTNGYNGVQGETKNSSIRNCIIHTNKNWVGSNGVGISLWGDNDNNTISNNTIYDNDRQGIFIGYSDDTRISTGNKIVNNTIHDNGKYTQALGPDESEYGVQLWNADYNLIQGNTIYNQNDWSFGNGVYLCSSRYNTVAGNNIHDNKYNVGIWDCYGPLVGARSAAGNKIQANTLVDPVLWSVKTFSDAATTYVNFNVFSTATTNDKYVANSSAATLNAEYNWFGGEAPPDDPTDFDGSVDHDPYFATDMTVSVIPSVYYMPLNGTVDVPVMALVPAGTYLRGTDVTLSWDNDTDIPDQSGPTQGSFFTAKVGAGQSEFYDYSPHTVVNTVRVNQALVGGSTGAGSASIPYVGVLFTMNYKGMAAGTSNLTLSSVQVRDVNNNDFAPVDILNGQLVVDVQNPSVTNVVIHNTTLSTDANSDGFDEYVKTTDNVTVTATVTDNNPLTTADIFADLSGFYGGSGHTADNPSYDAGTGLATWTVTGVNCSPANGTITVNVLARDVAGNEGTGSDDIIADNTAPSTATALVAKTVTPGGHNKVSLSWTAGSDASPGTYKGVLIRYNQWSYPTYPAGSTPTYPAAPTGGVDGFLVSAPDVAGTHTTTNTTRNVYYYSAFAVDWAGNYAALDGTGTDRSASYYRGDVGSGTGVIPGSGYDGLVGFSDLMMFSLLYFQTSPTGTDAEADFAPTEANKTYGARHQFGIPRPDAKIDFEDLMIFAMNYMNVAPKLSPPTEVKPAKEFALELRQQLFNSEEMLVTIHLANDGRSIKGTSILLRYDPIYLAVRDVTGGPLFGPLGQFAFFAHKEGNETVQIDAAALGVDRTVDYSGNIGTIRFKVLKSGETGLRFDGVKVRNGANEEVSTQTKLMEGVSTTIPLPTTYDIAQNYPNPFNPTTTIVYQVPEVAHVTLEVYNVLGDRVATLVDNQQAAGYYRVEWNGKDSGQRTVSSGVYYYRMSAGQFTSIKKMMLVK